MGTTSVGLPGPGGQTGSGFPMPRRGYLTGLHVWDGADYRYDVDEIAFNAGDVLSIYCQAGAGDYTVKLRLNGNSSNMQIESVPFNSTLYVTVEFLIIRD